MNDTYYKQTGGQNWDKRHKFVLCVCPLLSVSMRVEHGGAREVCMRVFLQSGQKEPTTNTDLLLHDCTDQTLHTLPPTTVTQALTWCISGVKDCEWMCVCVIMSMHIWTRLCVCAHVCQRKNIHVWCVCRCVFVHLTSLSLFSYLLAFLPWLFLLSFFRSDWDLSRESCFILCSIWYLLNVAWSRGKIRVNAGTPAWYLPEPYQVQKIQEWVCSFRITGSVLICNFSSVV